MANSRINWKNSVATLVSFWDRGAWHTVDQWQGWHKHTIMWSLSTWCNLQWTIMYIFSESGDTRFLVHFQLTIALCSKFGWLLGVNLQPWEPVLGSWSRAWWCLVCVRGLCKWHPVPPAWTRFPPVADWLMQ